MGKNSEPANEGQGQGLAIATGAETWAETLNAAELLYLYGHGTTDWFQLGKGVCQGCILSPCLFNLSSQSYGFSSGHVWM